MSRDRSTGGLILGATIAATGKSAATRRDCACLCQTGGRAFLVPMTRQHAARPLRKILGLGFGLAIVFGGTVGVGILRLPGVVAAALGDPASGRAVLADRRLSMRCSAPSPSLNSRPCSRRPADFVSTRSRAFGNGVGFVIGWCDWLCNVAALVLRRHDGGHVLHGALFPIAGADSKWIAADDHRDVHAAALGGSAARQYSDELHQHELSA